MCPNLIEEVVMPYLMDMSIEELAVYFGVAPAKVEIVHTVEHTLDGERSMD